MAGVWLLPPPCAFVVSRCFLVHKWLFWSGKTCGALAWGLEAGAALASPFSGEEEAVGAGARPARGCRVPPAPGAPLPWGRLVVLN